MSSQTNQSLSDVAALTEAGCWVLIFCAKYQLDGGPILVTPSGKLTCIKCGGEAALCAKGNAEFGGLMAQVLANLPVDFQGQK